MKYEFEKDALDLLLKSEHQNGYREGQLDMQDKILGILIELIKKIREEK